MRKKILSVILACLCLYQLSCVVSENIHLSPQGQGIHIDLKSGNQVKGELLSFQDGVLYVFDKSEGHGRIVEIASEDLVSARIRGLANTKWVGFVIGLEVVPAAIFFGELVAYTEVAGTGFILLSLPVILTTALFAVSTPGGPSFRTEDMQTGTAADIRKYARFPQGLSPDQLGELLWQCGQKEPVILK
jgi:hypothetical protein